MAVLTIAEASKSLQRSAHRRFQVFAAVGQPSGEHFLLIGFNSRGLVCYSLATFRKYPQNKFFIAQTGTELFLISNSGNKICVSAGVKSPVSFCSSIIRTNSRTA